MKKTGTQSDLTAAQRITDHIAELDDWRGNLLARLRQLILEAVPGIMEEWKWGTPVWSLNGNVVAAGAFRDHVKLNFFKGASLKDTKKMFNSGLDARVTRAIDFFETDQLNEAALKDLFKSAAALNASGSDKR